MFGLCSKCGSGWDFASLEDSYAPDRMCGPCYRKAHGLPVDKPLPELAVWYMRRAEDWACEAEDRRSSWCDMQTIRWAQDRSFVYATLAQQAAARYGAVQP